MNDLSKGFELLLGRAAFKLWPNLPRDMRRSSLRRLFPTAFPCDTASRYFFMTVIRERHTRLGQLAWRDPNGPLRH